ncbi:MAG TPA: hypothetical protein VNS32_16435, partial [Flavisolibacter sp.]|nr:hypothetical protein [Flavisolibacter sp.]
IGGLFSSYSNSLCSKGIARLNTDGSLDASFNSGSTGANSSIVAIAIQKTDKKILIGGDFTGFNGTLRSKIARINPDGTLDPSFNPGTGVAESIFSGPTVNSIAVQLDGKIVIGGLFDSYNGTSRRRVARINSDGSIDNTFNPGIGVNGSVYAVAVQSDGKILIGGGFPTYNGVTCNGLIRVNADGSVDASYKIGSGTGSSGEIDCIAIQGDGKILIGGTFTSFNGSSCSRIARLNTDGTLDPTFSIGSGANYTIKAITVQSDGKILVGGSFYSYRGADLYYLARLNADGTVDATFKPGTGANAQVSSIAIDGDGKILITGAFTNFNGVNSSYIARLYTNGTADASFNSGGGIDNSINTAIIQDDGNIVVGGSFTSYNNIGRNRLARVFGGSLDMGVIASSSFCPGSTINLPFTVKGAYNAGNVFTVQLSNAAGSFAAPVNIGTLASTVSGTISATIPTATTAGTGYRIRVVSSNPVVTSSNNGSNLTINAVTAITTQPSSQTKNEGDRVDFSVTASGSNLHYQWKKGTTTVGVDANAYSISSASTADAGDYTVIITGDCGSVTSSTATLKVKTTPTFNFALSVTKTYGDIDFSDAANSTNPASINYSSSDTSIATISNAGVVHIIKAGTVTF